MTATTVTGLAAGDPLAAGWRELAGRGLLNAQAFGGSRGRELEAVRRVAADGPGLALGRVFDGHRNALERLLVHRPSDVPPALRGRVATGELALGVWGADPGPQDGPPAVLVDDGDGDGDGERFLEGVKTFCSGAGLLDAAIVLVRRAPDGPPTLPVLVDLRTPGTVEIDEDWFEGGPLAASRSDRVVFRRAPVLAVLGTEGTLSDEPWISGDALRSTAVWAGGVDAILRGLRETCAARTPGAADLERLGRADAIAEGVGVWLRAGLSAIDAAHASPGASHGRAAARTIGAMRLELTERIRDLLRLSAELVGSRGVVTGTPLAGARGDLDVLLLQHRLGRLAERRGRTLLDLPDAR